MNDTETATVVERITNTWPNGPRGFIWTEAFGDHPDVESRSAGAAYRLLRDGGLAVNERITVARFLAEERAQRGHQLETATGPACPTCDGTGLRSAQQLHGTTVASVVVACADCGAGALRARTLRRIDDANAAENRGYRQPHGPVIVEPGTSVDGPEISFDEYVAVLTTLAHQGNTDAAHMLDVWAENLSRTPKGNL